ncbi:MAG: leucine-rich repeat domain-containing protein, partial [Clostridia bacterium]|nr:leucine-rich repeat domain-containing protein [Clostridia bacterium]
ITIPNSVTTIGEVAFNGCTDLTSITIPNSVTDIGSGVFAFCEGLTSITVAPDNKVYRSAGNCLIKTASKTLVAGCKNSVIPTDGTVTTIGSSAFEGCTGLTSITIPNSVTTIGSYAFYDSYDLTSITIPDSVTTIGERAFYYCKNLTDVYYVGTQQEWNNISIDSYNNELFNANIHFTKHCSENEHVFGETVETKSPTCVESGVGVCTCSICGETKTLEIPANPNLHSGIKLRTVAPTCTESGYDLCRCTICNTVYTVPGEPALGHILIDGQCLICGVNIQQENLKVGTQTHKNGNTRLILKLSASAEEIATYKDTGFVVNVNGEKTVISVDSVYDSFYNNGTLITAESLNCTYVAFLEIGNLSTVQSVTIQGFYTDKNGATHYGTQRTIK